MILPNQAQDLAERLRCSIRCHYTRKRKVANRRYAQGCTGCAPIPTIRYLLT